jgi:hypothetical protein
MAPDAAARLACSSRQCVSDLRILVDKAMIIARLAAAVPQFHHVETGKTLDHRM